MTERKYLGVPTQEEVIQQFNEISEMTKDITTLEQVLEFKKEYDSKGIYINIEINYDLLNKYDGKPIEVIRYEYKNILVYVGIKEGKAEISPYITLYDDNGEQFADERYDNYDQEIERVYKMGHLIPIN